MCLISLLAAIFCVLYGFALTSLTSLPAETMTEIIKKYNFDNTPEMISAIYGLASNGVYFATFHVLEIVGLALLIRGRYVGFHIYAASQLGVFGIFVIVFGFLACLSFLVWNVCWILVYHRASKHLNVSNV